MTTTLKALNDYGPRQFGDRIAFSEWQFERALRLELIPAADQGGRWSATVFNDVVARLDAVRAAVGTVPDVGATRAEEYLAERFNGLTVHPGTAAELARRSHLPTRGDYRGHTLYCGLTLEGFTDRRKVERASRAGQLHMRDEAARVLGLRDSDFTAGCPVVPICIERSARSSELRHAGADFFRAWRGSLARHLVTYGIDGPRADRLATLAVSAVGVNSSS